MLAIAGGIILAVLFFMFLGDILILAAGLIGIALLIGVCVGIYLLFNNYFVVDNIPIHTSIPVREMDFTYVIILIVVVAICVLIAEIADNTSIFKKKSDNEVNILTTFYIPAYSPRKDYVIGSLLKIDGINSVIKNDYREIRVNFCANKTSREAIDIIIKQLLDEK